jgi:hypothetical protein
MAVNKQYDVDKFRWQFRLLRLLSATRRSANETEAFIGMRAMPHTIIYGAACSTMETPLRLHLTTSIQVISISI